MQLPKIIITLYELLLALLSSSVFSCLIGIASLIIGGFSLWISVKSLRKINSVEDAVSDAKRRMTLQRIVNDNRDKLVEAHTAVSCVSSPEEFINLMDPIWSILSRIADIDPRYEIISDTYTKYSDWYYVDSPERLRSLQSLKMEIVKILSKLLNDIDQEG